MAGFGSLAKPYVENPYAGRITKVHWRKKDTVPCEGTVNLSGKWGTLDDNSFVNETTSASASGVLPLSYWRQEFNGFFAGASNNTRACNIDYIIASSATIAGTNETEENLDIGTLRPGQSFIVGIVRAGWLDVFAPSLPSQDRIFTYGFGEHRLLEVTLFTRTYDP
jgi:hypothetical protein